MHGPVILSKRTFWTAFCEAL